MDTRTVTARKSQLVGSWKIRRTFMFVIAAFCIGTVAIVLFKGLDTGPAGTAVTMSYSTLIALAGFYVGGVAWEDISIAKLIKS